MIYNQVYIEMDDGNYWYAIIDKRTYHRVIILCDTTTNVCYTYGGSDLNIVKNIHVSRNNSELYDVFMRKIGKMCKKKIDNKGHYFSDVDGFVTDELINKYVSKNIEHKIKNISRLKQKGW